jgi:hypothetical protein
VLNVLTECYRRLCDPSNFKRSLKALKVDQGIVDVAANGIPRISVTDENKDAKGVVTTLEEVSKAWIDASWTSSPLGSFNHGLICRQQLRTGYRSLSLVAVTQIAVAVTLRTAYFSHSLVGRTEESHVALRALARATYED